MFKVSDEVFGTGRHSVEKIEDVLPLMRSLYAAQCEEGEYIPQSVSYLTSYYCLMEQVSENLWDCACFKLRQFHGLK